MHNFTANQISSAYEGANCGELKKRGGELAGPCPSCGGEDRFWIRRDGSFGCRGCQPGKSNPDAFAAIMQALDLGQKQEDQVYPRSVDPPKERGPQVYGCTLEQYAERTQLPIKWLKRWPAELSEDDCWISEEIGRVQAVFFPAQDDGGKFRVAVEGGQKYRYKKGSTAALYGADWLWSPKVETTGRIVITEGESCAQTCWHYDIAAVGIPGSTNWKVLADESFRGHLLAVREFYVIQESDKAGGKFPAAVKDQLRELGSTAEVIALPLPAKDVNDLHKEDPDKFLRRFQKAAKEARKAAGMLEWRPTSLSVDATLRPIDWVCFPLLRPVFSVIWAPSYAGKSTLVLQICDAVARGDNALGVLRCPKAGVRFVGFEQGDLDERRRMWDHVGVQPGQHKDVDFLEIGDCPRADEGGIAAMDRMLRASPNVRLLVIDTLARFWSPSGGKKAGNAYYQETNALRPIEKLAKDHNVCVLAITHSTASKVKLSGTEAMRGIPRTVLHLDRPDPEEPHGCIKASHNGAPGSQINLMLETGKGWVVDDSGFAEGYHRDFGR